MPCVVETQDEEIHRVRRELDKLTDMLCWQAKSLEKQGLAAKITYPKWWEKHRKMDEERKANKEMVEWREKHQKSAKAKLTLEELDALGLK